MRGAAGDPKVAEQVLHRVASLEDKDKVQTPISPYTDADREVIMAVYQRLTSKENDNDDNR